MSKKEFISRKINWMLKKAPNNPMNKVLQSGDVWKCGKTVCRQL